MTTNTANELVRMDHISKYYGRVQALDDVSLAISGNEIVGLLGDNGAGKSTTSRNMHSWTLSATAENHRSSISQVRS